MDLIIGGAYQGKTDYVRRTYNLSEEDICDCALQGADYSRRCLLHFEREVLRCLQENRPVMLPERSDAVITADDVFCGVVPVDTETRAFREECGRTLTALAARSATVTRIFCGLPMRIKE